MWKTQRLKALYSHWSWLLSTVLWLDMEILKRFDRLRGSKLVCHLAGRFFFFFSFPLSCFHVHVRVSALLLINCEGIWTRCGLFFNSQFGAVSLSGHYTIHFFWFFSWNLVVGGFPQKNWISGYKCGHASLLSEEQLVWLTEIVECRFAGAIYSPQFHLTLPLTVAFAPLRETEHTLKYKSGESRHIRTPTPPCRTIDHRRAVAITLPPPGAPFTVCLISSLFWRKISLSFQKNVHFQRLTCQMCDCAMDCKECEWYQCHLIVANFFEEEERH